MSDFVGVPVALIGVGPARDEVIWTQAATAVKGSGRAAAAA
jgi:adenylosuccinate synthase